jgi:hypothetical protein
MKAEAVRGDIAGVRYVTKQWMARRCKVDPQLMPSSGYRPQLNQRDLSSVQWPR